MSAELKPGDIINNGHYYVRLDETPRQQDDGRWAAYGVRYIRSRRTWDTKRKLYGWNQLFPVTDLDVTTAVTR
jgi:hypothetical protein